MTGVEFLRTAPRHDLRRAGRYSNYPRVDEFRCERCKRYFVCLGQPPRGRCGVPELAGNWRVGDRNGTVVKIDRGAGTFTLLADGIESEHTIGTPDDNATRAGAAPRP